MKRLEELNLPAKEKQVLSIVKKILMEKFDISRLVLFGSKARGDDDLESDIDILVISNYPLNRNQRHKITDEIFEINLEHNTNLSSTVGEGCLFSFAYI